MPSLDRRAFRRLRIIPDSDKPTYQDLAIGGVLDLRVSLQTSFREILLLPIPPTSPIAPNKREPNGNHSQGDPASVVRLFPYGFEDVSQSPRKTHNQEKPAEFPSDGQSSTDSPKQRYKREPKHDGCYAPSVSFWKSILREKKWMSRKDNQAQYCPDASEQRPPHQETNTERLFGFRSHLLTPSRNKGYVAAVHKLSQCLATY